MVKVKEPACVLMKRKASLVVMKKTAGMTLEEEMAFWEKRGAEMVRRLKTGQAETSHAKAKPGRGKASPSGASSR